jgi:hypothetical protein
MVEFRVFVLLLLLL